MSSMVQAGRSSANRSRIARARAGLLTSGRGYHVRLVRLGERRAPLSPRGVTMTAST